MFHIAVKMLNRNEKLPWRIYSYDILTFFINFRLIDYNTLLNFFVKSFYNCKIVNHIQISNQVSNKNDLREDLQKTPYFRSKGNHWERVGRG